MTERDRGPWIIAGAIVLAALIVVVGFVWWQTKQEACDRWRDDYRAVAEAAAAETEAAPVVPGAPVVPAPSPGPASTRAREVADRRPGGCGIPETRFPFPSPSGMTSAG